MERQTSAQLFLSREHLKLGLSDVESSLAMGKKAEASWETPHSTQALALSPQASKTRKKGRPSESCLTAGKALLATPFFGATLQ